MEKGDDFEKKPSPFWNIVFDDMCEYVYYIVVIFAKEENN